MNQITFTAGTLQRLRRAFTAAAAVALLLITFLGNAQTWDYLGPQTGISAGGASYINFAKGVNGALYMSYYDTSVAKGSVQQYSGGAWSYLGGSAGITTGTATYNSICADANGNVYYTNQLGWPGSGMEVRAFNGTAWSALPSVTIAGINYQASAVSSNGILVAANGEASGTAKRYVNGAWEQLGATGFAGGTPTYLRMVAGNNGVVYASYNNGGYVHVSKIGDNATTTDAWTAVGTANVGAAASSENYNSAIAIDQNNNLYLAYVSGSAGGNKLNVKKYDGTNWTQLGSENFTTGKTQHVSIAVTASGIPYVAVSNWEDADFLKNYVMAYNAGTNTWTQLGTGYVSAGQASYNALATDADGNVILAYADNSTGTIVARKYTVEDVTPVTAVTVTTQNSAPATITTNGGTLQLVGTVTPAEASQAVTWSITSGSEFATISSNGLVTASANGTVTVRATSVADATKFGELNVVVTIEPTNNCPALTSLYENFDTLSCCDMGVVPTCWNSLLLGGASQIISSTQPASGTSQIYQNGYGTGKISIVALPQFSNVNAGTHQFRFKVKANSGPGALDFGYITDVNDATTFVVIQALTISNSSYTSAEAERTIAVPATVPANARLAVRNPGTTWAGMYWDDVYWELIPVTAVTITTQNNVPATITTNNGTLQLVATVAPAAASQAVTWSITSGSEFATIDANGLVTATGNGTVVVTATSVVNTAITTTFTVTVSGQVTTPVIAPVTITAGFNHDIIANSVGNASASSTIGFDETNSRALVSLDFQATSSSTLPTYGLPANGLITSAVTPGVTFQLANYTGPNALFLTPSYVNNGAANSGTLNFSAVNAANLYILAGAAGGGVQTLPFTATVHFTDNTTQVNTLNVNDWYNGTGAAITGAGRVNRANNNLEGDAFNPRLYEITLPVTQANQSKNISGISFSFDGSQGAEYANEIRMSVLAITTGPVADTPVSQLVVVPNNNAPAAINTNQGTLELHAVYNNQDLYGTSLIWSIVPGNTGTATVDIYGKVTAVANGTVTVQAALASDNTVVGQLDIVITNQASGYCESYFVNGCSFLSINSVTTTGGTVNLANANSGCSNDNSLTGYGDFTEQNVQAGIGQTVTFNLNFSTDTAYLSGWIDWNQNFIFEDSEGVYLSSDAEAASGLNFAVTVPAGAVLGNTRIRLKAVNGWEGSGPCGYNSIGEVEDYTFTVTEAVVTPVVTITTQNNAPATITTNGGTLQLVATVTPVAEAVTWTVSTGSSLATISATGLVTAIANGTITVTATTVSGATDTYDVVITNQNIVATAIEITTLNNVAAAITTNAGTLQLVATITPANTTDTAVVWSITSGTGLATIDANGLVTASANGTITITATTANGTVTDTLDVVITNQVVEVTAITITTLNNVPATIVTISGTLQLIATVTPTNATDTSVVWSITSGSEFGTIDENGVITATANGTVTVTATSANGITATFEVVMNIPTNSVDTVTLAKVSVYPNPTNGLLNIETTQQVTAFAVYNTIGQEVTTGKGNIVNLQNAQQGIYLVQITLEGGASQTVKVVRN